MTVQNIIIQQGSTFERNIALTDANNNPLNISGFTANAAIMREPGSNTAYDFEVNLTTGNLQIRMEANTTIQLTPGFWVYDIILTNGTDTYRPAEGLAQVTPGIATI